MKYKVTWTATKLGFFGDTVIPGAEIIEASDIEDAWEVAEARADRYSYPGRVAITLNDVQPLKD